MVARPQRELAQVRERRSPLTRTTLLLLVAMMGLALVAIVPPFLFRDRGTDLPPIVLLQLRAEASRGYTIPPGVMHVTDVRAYGEYPYRVEGTVSYRALFGLAVASARTYNSATRYDFDAVAFWGSLLSFILGEGLLGVLALRSARTKAALAFG